jgi:hypothetical protein
VPAVAEEAWSMPSLGWQEGCIFLVLFFVTWLAPVLVVWRGSRRRTGEVAVGWVIVVVVLGWLGALVWALFGRRSA